MNTIELGVDISCGLDIEELSTRFSEQRLTIATIDRSSNIDDKTWEKIKDINPLDPTGRNQISSILGQVKLVFHGHPPYIDGEYKVGEIDLNREPKK
jgi:hypothetical protein